MTITPQKMTYVVDGVTFELDTESQRVTITAKRPHFGPGMQGEMEDYRYQENPVKMKLKDFLEISDVFRGPNG